MLRNTHPSNILPDTSNTNQSHNQLANSLNTHFANITKSLNIDCNSPSSNQPNAHPSHFSSTDKLPLITPNEVILLFKEIDIKKATGVDNLSVRILQMALPFIILIITDILNRALKEAVFPAQWKTAIITPLHKGGDANDFSNYRPISVLPVLSKIYEKHIL